MGEFPQLFWNSIVPQDFPLHSVECFFKMYKVDRFFSAIHFIALECSAK